MNQNIKNILGGAIIVTILGVGYASLRFVKFFGESIQPSSFRSFSVTGQGKAIAIPDVAEFTFTVITQGGTDIASLQSKNTAAANKAIAFVKSEGVADNDIQTQYYDVSPNYQTYNCNNITPLLGGGANIPAVQPCPPSSIVGYTITQTVDVKIRDFTKIGDIMGGIVTNGANQVGQLSFTLDDPSAAQNQAEADAIAKAKVQAQAVAQAGGFKIGHLLNIEIGGVSPVYNQNVGMGAMAMSAVAAPTPAIQTGSEEIDMSVTLQYEIQ